jgi:hypothetical protein
MTSDFMDLMPPRRIGGAMVFSAMALFLGWSWVIQPVKSGGNRWSCCFADLNDRCRRRRLAMDVCLLNYFIVLAEEKNLELSAIRLNMQNERLVQHMSVLENELGLGLFRHSRSGVELTPAGESFLRFARLIMAEAETTQEDGWLIDRLSERTQRWAGLYRIVRNTSLPDDSRGEPATRQAGERGQLFI